MKQILTKIFFVAIISLCGSFTASAQRDDNRHPPKDKPPVVVVPSNKDKPKDDKDDKKDDKRNDNRRPRKPEAYGFSAAQLVSTIYD